MPGRDSRFTIYDALEKKGYFDANAANSYARDTTTGATLYKGPVQFPKMFYHPEGLERTTVEPEIMNTPLGAKLVGEQRELIWKIADSKAEADSLVAEGWHDHPAKAIRSRVENLIQVLAGKNELDDRTKAKLLSSIPTMGSDQRIRDLEAELARLTGLVASEAQKRAADED